MKTATSLVCLGLILAALLLGGCSGAGVDPGDIAGANIRAVAASHLSTVALLGGWLKSIYYRTANTFTITLDEVLPDGRRHVTGVNSDGSTFEYWQNPNNSGRGVVTYPGGFTVNITYDTPTTQGAIGRQQMTEEWSTGLTMTILFESDWSRLPARRTRSGTATIRNGTSMTYRLLRVDGQDTLTLDLPDGARLIFACPTRELLGGYVWPRFAQGANGSYRDANGTLTFQLADTGGAWWQQMTFTTDTGFSGDFTIDDEFIGSGQLRENGSLVGALNWNADAVGMLNLLNVGQEEVTASAAARDFRLDQWANHAALMGPNPF